jgi:hypothetical protein
MATVGLAAGFHPEIVPSSVAKMKRAGLPGLSRKSPVLLDTWPVGVDTVPIGEPAGGGMVTTRGLPTGKGCPAPLYRVENPAPLSETQKGEVAEWDIPQGFFRFESVFMARPGISETRLVWTYPAAAAGSARNKTTPMIARLTKPRLIQEAPFLWFIIQSPLRLRNPPDAPFKALLNVF